MEGMEGTLSSMIGLGGSVSLLAGAAAALALVTRMARRFTEGLPEQPSEAQERREDQYALAVVGCLAATALSVQGALDFRHPKAHVVGVFLLWILWYAAMRLSLLRIFQGANNLFTFAIVPPMFLVREAGPGRIGWNVFGLMMALWVVTGAALTRNRAREKERVSLLRRLSHNLRTPAAGIRSLAEALERNDVADPAERARCLALIRGEADRLSVGLDRMLRAAKGEVRVAPSKVPLDLAEWARAAEARWRTRLPGLRLEAQGPIPAVADPELLDEGVDALLDNAMRYGAPGVLLEVKAHPYTASIEVEDGGSGPKAGERERVEKALSGEVVERAGTAATPDGQGGYGLGLWAVAEVAKAHGGIACLKGKARFALTFPHGATAA